MQLTIWGARGSIPTPMTTSELRDRMHAVVERSRGINLDDPNAIERFINRLPNHINTIASGNTTCYELRIGDRLFIFDMGSGFRLLGQQLMQEHFAQGEGEAYIFISHTHYDHMEGFPFFVPAFIPGNHLHFHSAFDDMEQRLRELMRPPFFPVNLDYPQAKRSFHVLEEDTTYTIAGVEVSLLELNHPGKSYAYRIAYEDKVLVYATDGEYPNMNPEATAPYEAFFRNADALIFDAMYTYEDAVTLKQDWGHSTAKAGAELAARADVGKLILTHHDPLSTSQELWAKIDDADAHLRHKAAREGTPPAPAVEVLLATEGLTLEI